MTKVDLKNYVCTAPFRFLHVHEENQYFLCIPEWLIKRNPLNQPLSEIWNSEDSLESRRSVMDGTFRHCDATQCPYLSYLLKFNEVDPKGPIYHKDNLPTNIKEKFINQDPYMEVGPEKIEHNFDKSCNYKCPSCRKETYKATQEKLVEVENTMAEMKQLFSKDAKTLYFTASGDPFVSNTFRTFLQTFNKEEYPKLRSIHLHTNASMWTEKMWNTMPNIHKYVKTCEISIDAATKETYENKVRLNGNWDNLINNLKFISTIPSLEEVRTSFVVQHANYKEMRMFADLIRGIFGKKASVLFIKINNWGTFNCSQYEFVKIWDPIHPEYNDFIEEVKKIWIEPQVYHNLHDVVDIDKKII